MNVYDLIIKVPIIPLTKEIWRYYQENIDDELTSDFCNAFERTLNNLQSIKPVDTGGTIVAKVYESDCFDVYSIDRDGNDNGLVLAHWCDVLGYTVSDTLIQTIGEIPLAAAIIYEMTWYGQLNEENEKAIIEIFEENDVIDNEYKDIDELIREINNEDEEKEGKK